MMSIKKDGAMGGKMHLPLRRAEEWTGLLNSIGGGEVVAGNQTAKYFFLISVFRFNSAMVP